MKNDEIYNLWNEFINDSIYKKYFISNEDDWKVKLEELKEFININNARPTQKTNEDLHSWLSNQLSKSKQKQQIMKNNEIYSLWIEFINNVKYKQYFNLDNVRDWKIKLNEFKDFINKYNSLPTGKNNRKLYDWSKHQSRNRRNRTKIMKNDEIYNLWTEFITDSRYKKYFE